MTRSLLILKTGSVPSATLEQVGDFEAWFLRGLGALPEALGVRVTVLDVTCQALPVELPSAAIITGSLSSAYEPLAWIPPTEAWLRGAVTRQMPILGVCFGHQLLAQALGGRVGRNPRGWELGRHPVVRTPAGEEDPLLGATLWPLSEAGPTPALVQESHQDVVLEPPPGAQVLAHSPIDGHHAFRLGEKTWTLQFHPEMGAPELTSLLTALRAPLQGAGTERGLPPGAQLQGALESLTEAQPWPALLQRFLLLALGIEAL